MQEYTLYLRRTIHWPRPDNFTYLDWIIQEGVPPSLAENDVWNVEGTYRRQNVRFVVCYAKNLEAPSRENVRSILEKAWKEYV